MTQTIQAAFGSWPSDFSADLVTASRLRLSSTTCHGDSLYWIEQRPSESGRSVLMRQRRGGPRQEVLPTTVSVGNRVHEYGGGDYGFTHDHLVYCDDADQRLYRVKLSDNMAQTQPQALTPANQLRYADLQYDPLRHRLLCVVEQHNDAQPMPENALVTVDLDSGRVDWLVRGHDFYAAPHISPCGRWLAYVCWNQPNMPWDGSQLYVKDLDSDDDPQCIAGGEQESVCHPLWSPEGQLYFVSDRSGWWNLYRWTPEALQAVWPDEAEYGLAHWQFGQATYGFAGARQLLAIRNAGGQQRLVSIQLNDQGLGTRCQILDFDFTAYQSLALSTAGVGAIVGSPVVSEQVVWLDPDELTVEVCRSSLGKSLDPARVSVAQSRYFPAPDGTQVQGFYYAPTHPNCEAPEGDRPPLIVLLHGGPTGQTSDVLDVRKQFWTSRGFALLDINYRGSTGFGRAYREQLVGRWGEADVEDCVAGVNEMVRLGLADPNKVAIRGGSAGGFTVLAALAFTDRFNAGASYYGIGDLLTLAQDTHKFEARYLDRLVGPLPASEALYRARSPINAITQIHCPVILFQGLNDKVVPPSQAEAMLAALKAQNTPVVYVPFEGEGHGFRGSHAQKTALLSEWYFYGQVFGYDVSTIEAPFDV